MSDINSRCGNVHRNYGFVHERSGNVHRNYGFVHELIEMSTGIVVLSMN